MALCDSDSRHHVKLQVFCRNFRSKTCPTRVIIRVKSVDVAEICLDEKSGKCWMGLMTTTSNRTLECYESLVLVLSMLGHDGARILGRFGKFAALSPSLSPHAKVLLQGLPADSTACLCQAGRLLGWPCVMNRTEGRLVLYFSDNKKPGTIMDVKYLRRLDDPWDRLHCKTPAINGHVCPSISVPEIDEYGLPTDVGYGFASTAVCD